MEHMSVCQASRLVPFPSTTFGLPGLLKNFNDPTPTNYKMTSSLQACIQALPYLALHCSGSSLAPDAPQHTSSTLE